MDLATQVLTYIKDHPQQTTVIRRGYQNTISFRLKDTLIFPGLHEWFPENRLNAFKLADSFISHHRRLVRWLGEVIDPDDPPEPTELWLTFSHVTDANFLYVEVSFE
ncbi:hypothetical protein ACFQ3L_10110 [Lacticaseibacillus jixianensis]|uniref:Uncharacterized protein n=1 Tax=Lacticaseibacillus jixianensis TaxID=2486012 RepID=A0ABW4BAG4_9LACO|nr:hypothetical protein [Lacticaseibacillus jixianensis]